MIPKPLATAIICLVTLVWLANFAAQFLVDGYQVDGWIHSIFFTVVGGALALSNNKKKNDPPGPGEPPDAPPAPAGPDGPPAPPSPPELPRASGAHRARLRMFLPRSVMS